MSPKVDVYWNLHRLCWSIRRRGKVVHHCSDALLERVAFVVQPAGREKVRREKRKTVHAFARGDLMSFWPPPKCFEFATGVHGVTYNPYVDEAFVTGAAKFPVVGASAVWLTTVLDHATLQGRPKVWAKEVVFG